jgi:cytochrome c oxidase cbb3-type subunit 4
MSDSIWGHVTGIVTVILMATFIGIWIWAWRARHKRLFDRMARLPLEDDSHIGERDADTGAGDQKS